MRLGDTQLNAQRSLRVTSRGQILDLVGRLGLSEQLDAGGLCCEICGISVSADNVFAMYPDRDNVRIVCDTPECIRTFALRAQRLGLQ